MFQSIQNFDVEGEFRIMCGFPEFQGIYAANESKEGIKCKLDCFIKPDVRCPQVGARLVS